MERAVIETTDKGLCIVLTRETSSALGVSEGDEVTLIPTANSLVVTTDDSETALQVALGHQIMDLYPETLETLAR